MTVKNAAIIALILGITAQINSWIDAKLIHNLTGRVAALEARK